MARRFPNRDWMYATPAQESFIRVLRKKTNKYPSIARVRWPEIQRRLLKTEASTEIEMLKPCAARAEAYDKFLSTAYADGKRLEEAHAWALEQVTVQEALAA
jgi:hypothetical protein